MCGVQVSCQSQELPLSWLISKCVHILPLMVSSYAINPRPSGARVDLNKPHQALRKHCLSQVWRWSPDDAPSADRHDKQFLREWQRPFGSYLDKVLFWAKQQKIFTVMYNLTEKACELQKVKEVRMWLIGFNVSAWDARHERLLPKLYQCLWYFNNPTLLPNMLLNPRQVIPFPNLTDLPSFVEQLQFAGAPVTDAWKINTFN